ncbi:hypothetical protein ONZ45_g10484 [Pleurotus djamor]|nr:hypothetical protein ONZ45_g10484 [Pleurotus djamor]
MQQLPPSIRTNFQHQLHFSPSSNFHSDSSLSSNSPPTPSSKLPIPRSPYISSRQFLPSPTVQPSHTLPGSAVFDRPPSTTDSISSSTIEDVLYLGDIVGEGRLLQGEPVTAVPITHHAPQSQDDPATLFQVVRRLGTGSYAVVYLVREVLSAPPSDDGHSSLLGSIELDGPNSSSRRSSIEYGREFAIKCLSKANLDDDALAAQMSEARDHYGTEYSNDPSDSPSRTPPTPSLLSSLDPAQLLSRTRLRLIASMFAQMCDAVAACHAQQVFHRDIKPENFIVTDGFVTLPNGRVERKVIVKLTDFGLSTTDIESSDMDCGSAPYMSFECRNNVAPTYRPRAADVWSLGIVLINMLYHYNPWTDTSLDACNSFSAFRDQPVYFFMTRFVGMTYPVAEFLATKVFCILEDPSDDSQRISAAEFGQWVRDLPALLGVPGTAAHSRNGSLTGAHPLSSATQISHRPCSRPPSRCASALAMRTPAGGQTRSLSRAPSLGPAFEREEVYTSVAELSVVMDDEEHGQEVEIGVDIERTLATAASDTQSVITTESRSTSTNKRRKRGARKGKGVTSPSSATQQDSTLETLATASQSLARELSHASKTGSMKTMLTGSSHTSTMHSSVKSPLASSTTSNTISTTTTTKQSTGTNTVTPTPRAVPIKKPSKWKLSFGKASAPVLPPPTPDDASMRSSLAPAITSSLASDSVLSLGSQSTTSKHSRGSRVSDTPSATASNVTSVLMGLNAPAPNPSSSSLSIRSNGDDTTSTWSRGRRPRGSAAASTFSSNLSNLSSNNYSHSALNNLGSGGASRSRGPPGLPSTSPHRDRDRDVRRGLSPNSTRSGRPLASSASSMISNNWRNSMSTTSSAGTSTSAFTRYSNSSVGSVSTAATSVSSASWRTGPGKSNPSSPNLPSHANGNVPTHRPPTLPKNIKYMTGVPWELNELPRGLHPNPVGDIFGSPPIRKQRTRNKPKDLKLDTINERERISTGPKSPEHVRMDAATSTTDLGSMLDGASTDGPKKVQKGQITALAKMLSALRR